MPPDKKEKKREGCKLWMVESQICIKMRGECWGCQAARQVTFALCSLQNDKNAFNPFPFARISCHDMNHLYFKIYNYFSCLRFNRITLSHTRDLQQFSYFGIFNSRNTLQFHWWFIILFVMARTISILG